MKRSIIYPADAGTQNFGILRVNVNSAINALPVPNATISIFDESEPDKVVEQFTTNEIGQTQEIQLKAPPIDYSMEPTTEQPYSVYNLSVNAKDFSNVKISGTELLPNVKALQEIQMMPVEEKQEVSEQLYVIPPHTLYGDYPPKIAESEIKSPSESGEITLSRAVIPEYVIVHDGPPTDRSAKDYYVKYKDYIKNVASSEIYATWSEPTIQANILAIQSFTLNRVFTEWYRNKGLSFTITSSTAFDHKWMPGRNIYGNIGRLVDSLFSNYLSRPNVIQPILTQYCDGNKVQCPNWMTQWGSKYLGDKGYSPIDILRNFYGNNMFINTTNQVSGVPISWPGFELGVGSSGEKVKQIQTQLNVISKGYPMIGKVSTDGVYGENTAKSVKTFQKIFDLPETGVIDYTTWYKISEIYVAVSKIAEL